MLLINNNPKYVNIWFFFHLFNHSFALNVQKWKTCDGHSTLQGWHRSTMTSAALYFSCFMLITFIFFFSCYRVFQKNNVFPINCNTSPLPAYRCKRSAMFSRQCRHWNLKDSCFSSGKFPGFFPACFRKQNGKKRKLFWKKAESFMFPSQVYRHSYWRAIFWTTNSSPMLVRKT